MKKRRANTGERRPASRSWRDVADDLKLGVFWGALFAGAVCIWITMVYLVGGNTAFEQNGTSYGVAIFTYMLAGVASGLVLGCLRPLTNSGGGSAFVGFIAGLLAFTGFSIASSGFDWVGVVVCSALVGPIVGYNYWKAFHTQG